MKERLDKESIDALILYRLQRSEETIKEAELLCDKNFYNASVNRLYYACYYAISALFLKDGIEAYSHKGMKTLFGLYYVKTEKIPIEQATTYFTLFEKRHSSDYDDFIYFDREIVEELISQTKEFITFIKNLLGL